MFFLLLAVMTLTVLIRSPAYAEWTPLISTSLFDGLQADALTAAAGIVSVLLIILGIGLLVRVLSR